MGYVRVSSPSQSAATQRSAIARAARARGHTISQWYSDVVCGAARRPSLGRLRADARTGLIATVYVHRLDRLSRAGMRDLLTIVDELRSAGVRLISLDEGFALDGPAGDVVLAVIAWVAQMERDAIGDRIRAARDRLQAEGRRWGRPRRITDAELPRLHALRAEGRSLRSIAMALRVPLATVARTLRRVPKGAIPQEPVLAAREDR